ncbi:uncharacterized protein K452DRAFT_89077 [Aplosporella prunicola CBS 121167]|uniref:Uncharacterized protein n=1 Tax=Aplosporella prunicola CBS 121167 TaxID=1176127 RepID=A0A6A6B729_9PEZI|nr:uncharacterized protein K452DRAFT_89077 [Aplosporella prunicola CBS 121167]KAF2138611.1 hypothetical protein K452DRAFT_89077 [Aplosporella prunicola CBS 121167]
MAMMRCRRWKEAWQRRGRGKRSTRKGSMDGWEEGRKREDEQTERRGGRRTVSRRTAYHYRHCWPRHCCCRHGRLRDASRTRDGGQRKKGRRISAAATTTPHHNIRQQQRRPQITKTYPYPPYPYARLRASNQPSANQPTTHNQQTLHPTHPLARQRSQSEQNTHKDAQRSAVHKPARAQPAARGRTSMRTTSQPSNKGTSNGRDCSGNEPPPPTTTITKITTETDKR